MRGSSRESPSLTLILSEFAVERAKRHDKSKMVVVDFILVV